MRGSTPLVLEKPTVVKTKSIPANLWQGEADCVVGPFADRHVAETFANPAVDFGFFDAFSRKTVSREGFWYVEIQGLENA